MDFTELVSIIEEEISVAEELQRNLAEQQKALLAWDVAALLYQVEAREPWLRSLGELERRRHRVMKEITPYLSSMTLRELISKVPLGAPEHDRLSKLRDGARKAFTRLQAEERHVHGLIENLLAHIQEALSPLGQSDISLYGETGVATPRSRRPGLMLGKA
jgi:flagellar biosynthesis/type III secretory pathway chaperone